MNSFKILFCFLLLVSCSKDPVMYNVTISSTEGGTVSPQSGSFEEGSSVTFTATPIAEYLFTKWSNGSTQNPLVLTVTSDLTLQATFTKKQYELTISKEGEGTVSERVINTGKGYDSGTKVELTAVPAGEWVFAGWSGDVTSNDNPLQVTISSPKNIKATFKKIEYSLDITIIGNGQIVQSIKSITGSGVLINLTALAEECWEFKNWSGIENANNNSIELMLGLSEEKTIEVEFIEKEKRNVPQFSKTSYESRTYYNRNINQYLTNLPSWFNDPLDAVVIDYNMDGNLDVVHSNPNYGDSFSGISTRNKILFYDGDCNGNLTLNENLSNKFLGLIHGRKGLVGDYNNDGFPDIFLAGAGIDKDPFPGEYPVILFNDGGNDFYEKRFNDLTGFWHTATSGDYDNDGDQDIILISQGVTYILVNNGGLFEIIRDDINWDSRAIVNYPRKTIVPRLNQVYTSELYDIDKDGYLDLIVSGHDFPDDYQGESAILYGNGTNFLKSKKSLPSVSGFGICVDIDFYDINGDGIDEIILNRTGDPKNGGGFYMGWKVQILELINGAYIDSTDKYIDVSYGTESNWMYWLHISDYDNDGKIELFNDDLQTETSSYARPYREWELVNGRFMLKTD